MMVDECRSNPFWDEEFSIEFSLLFGRSVVDYPAQGLAFHV